MPPTGRSRGLGIEVRSHLSLSAPSRRVDAGAWQGAGDPLAPNMPL